MFHSLEVRVPLLDKEVIQVALRTDWQSCLDVIQKTGKIPLRKALFRHVKHQSHMKRGFDVPLHQWLKGPLRPMLEDNLLQRKEILGLNFLNGGVPAMAARHLSGQNDEAPSLWNLLHLSMWEQKHYKRSAKSFLHGVMI
jgi:asparagine synthase (glutamine-hydrolysing)